MSRPRIFLLFAIAASAFGLTSVVFSPTARAHPGPLHIHELRASIVKARIPFVDGLLLQIQARLRVAPFALLTRRVAFFVAPQPTDARDLVRAAQSFAATWGIELRRGNTSPTFQEPSTDGPAALDRPFSRMTELG